MKKVLLVVALLLLATPIFAADVTVTATKVGDVVTGADGSKLQQVDIGYTGAASADAIRAFALSLQTTLDANAVMSNIRGFKRGESKTGNLGYGIFPAKFRQYIQVQNPTTADWDDANYTPLAEWGDANAGWGINTKWIVVELGTLYEGPNSPGTSGTLFTIDVNRPAGMTDADCNLCIALDQIRGGVVKKDANAATVDLPPGDVPTGTPPGCIKITYGPTCVTPSNQVGVNKTTAVAAWAAQGFTGDGGTGKYSDTVAANLVISHETGCYTLPHTVAYFYSLGRFPTPAQLLYPRWDPDSNVPVYWSQVAGATSYQLDRSANSGSTWTNVYTGTATFKAERLETQGAFYRYRVMAKNADSNSLYMTGTVDCNAYLSRCYMNPADPCWIGLGRPDCWCRASGAQEPNGSGYQCDGDADGATGGANYRVYTLDQAMIVAHWKKTNAMITSDPNVTLAGKLKIHAACADVDHKAGGAAYRVYTLDQSNIVANWKKTGSSSITATNRLPGNCPRW